MEIQKFTSAHEMVAYLATLKPADHFRMAKAYGIKPETKADAHLVADYLVQGVSKGLSGPSLVQYALANVARLQSVMPHLKGSKEGVVTETASVVKPTTRPDKIKMPKFRLPKMPKRYTDAAQGKVGASVAKPKPAPKVAKVKYPDFTIVPRPDRGGFEGWFGGRAEAFRPTQEKVQAFFSKKYPQYKV